jgi:hypothetical protein
MEILKAIVWIIWGLVGLMSIGLGLYGFIFYRNFYKDFLKND